ncbi:hypothetical protein Pmani_034259 [Petrolisthes manimaculis]|uniref:Farnesoic acid O-methyl transferase domain-containing protein n=1 Tax=Petrolisthes manimaculis TaxID=1843537 RepID=A0AAE1NPN4_9EUCA|nr:hypothetical protein Pmani_034259 [Petrolisthes manimaculis]
MSVYHTDDTGGSRQYNFRRIQTTTIRFQVKAGHDVAICLSSDNEEEPEDMYEIFIGCWEGGESGIRRKKHDDVIRVETPDILSEDEFRTFWIKIQRGTIKVGRSGQRRAFMRYTDPETLLHVTWYGYSTGWGAEGDWVFPDDEDTSSSSSSAMSSSDSEAEDINNLEERPIQYKRPARWVPAAGGYFPRHPVSGGEGPDGEVYVGMAFHEGEFVLGMVVPDQGCCYIPYAGDAISKELYFVLSNPASVTLSWEPCSLGKVPPGALQGGRTGDGESLFIGRVSVDGIVAIGKVHPSHEVCYVPYGGSEHSHKNYEVLCVRNINVKV